MTAATQDVTNRQIENKSKLVFEFNLGGAVSLIRTLHFMENIDVRERVDTNYSEYTPLGNNGSVFTYLGAKSRSIDISFNITLPNIMAHTLVKPPSALKKSKVTQDSYFNAVGLGNTNLEEDQVKASVERFTQDFITNVLSSANDRDIYQNLREDRTVDSLTLEGTANTSFDFPNLARLIPDLLNGYQTGQSADTRLKALMQVMYWVNLIRSSVMTHSTQPSYGPPILRLVHGILYQNVPCIVTNYSISHDPNAGYDEVTYMPRILKVNLSLKEVRQRGERFDNSSQTNKYMMPGWDSLFIQDFATIDPTNVVSDTGNRGSI